LLTHDHFEQLCAAAVTGQISRDELGDLQVHMEKCADCRDFVSAIRQAIGPAILECADGRFPVKLPKGATQRFIAKAHSEGIPLGLKPRSRNRWSKGQIGVALVAVAAFIALSSILLYPKFLAEDQRPPSRTSTVILPSIVPKDDKEADDLRHENANLRELLAQSLSKMAASQQQLKAAESRISEIRTRLSAAEIESGVSQKTVQDRDAQIAQLKEDLDRQAAVKQADDIAIQTEESELQGLRETQERLTAELRRAEALAATAKDAKELIAARNLHVVDVNDVNENGKKQKPFGRVYYVEGKTLRFYAYDLGDPRKVDTKIQFYVWGEKDGVTVKTLGVLHSDSLADNRWRLDFSDTSVLAKIDSVFVTVENDQAQVSRPKGKRILDAVLGDTPNHP
jgi:hypothetical protein